MLARASVVPFLVCRKGATPMRIAQVAKRVERSIDTLRRYEADGTIPTAKRDFQGWRYYDEADIEEILSIIQPEKVPA